MNGQNAIDLFIDRARTYRERPALRSKTNGTWQKRTFGAWETTSREIAAGLVTLGVGVGDRCALIAQSRPEWLEVDIGILMAGAVSVPIYPSSTAAECEYIINDSGSKIVFAENAQQVEKLASQRATLGHVGKVVCIDDVPHDVAEKNAAWLVSLPALREQGRAWLVTHVDALEKIWRDVGRKDTVTIVYTSGTTGPPKGVVHTHGSLLWEAEAMKDVLPVSDKDVQLLFLPLAHIFARFLEWVVIYKGSEVAFAESIAAIKDNLREVSPTFMCAVPRVLEKVYLGILAGRQAASPARQKIFDWAFAVGKRMSHRLQHHEPIPLALSLQYAVASRLVFAKIHAALGGKMRFIVSGGAPLSKEIAEFFHAAGVMILEGWGLTETMAGTTINRLERFAFGTVGPAVPGIELRIAEDGEVLVRGGSVMKGYFNKPEATAEALDADGWFHTGDIGVIDDKGMLHITDRKKDLIVTAGGKNIAPQNLENALKAASPYVSQVVVHGDRRPYLTALLTLNEEAIRKWSQENNLASASLAELANHVAVRALLQAQVDKVNGEQPSYCTIKKFTVLATDFSESGGEMTPTLKVKRKVVTERHRDKLDAMYDAPRAY